MSIIKLRDFQGAMSFSVNANLEVLAQQEIDKYTKEWLIKIFGMDMAKDFILNYNTNPHYVKLFGELEVEYHSCFDYYGNNILYSRGIKLCLMGLVYFSLNQPTGFIGTSSGTKKVSQDLTQSIDIVNHVNNYINKSVEDVECIRAYIEKHIGDYPLYKYRNYKFLLNTSF